MRAAQMPPDRMHAEVQQEIQLQQAAGMKEPDVQKYWGIEQPKSQIISNHTSSNVAALMTAAPATQARIQQATKQAAQADADVRAASGIGGNPDERPDAVSQILGYGKAALEYATAGWTYATANAIGVVDQGPGAALARVPLPQADIGFGKSDPHLAPAALGDAVSQVAAVATMKPEVSDMSLASRQAAIDAFHKGEISDPSHFADAVVGRENVTPGMRKAIPSSADYQRAATQLLAQPGAVAHPTMARRVMANMNRIWVETGLNPNEQLQLAQSRPDMKEELLTQTVHGDPVAPAFRGAAKSEPEPLSPPPPTEAAAPGATPAAGEATSWYGTRANPVAPASPTFFKSPDEAMGMFRSLEGSADNAISKPQGTGHGGAMGRFQIMPATAAGYGFDPARLLDPDYNTMVAKTIITDLFNKYHGNREAMEIAYNSTPRRAAEYLAAGPGTRLEAIADATVRGGVRYIEVKSTKDESFLLPETQKYLANGRRRAGEKETGEPIGPDDYTAPPHAEVPGDVDVRNAEAEGDTEGAARAQRVADDQREEAAAADEARGAGEKITSGGIGAQSVWDNATDRQILDELGASIGVPDETPVRGLSLWDRTVMVASRLQPIKAADDLARQTIEGYDPEKEFSLLDNFRQAAHSDDRAKVAMGFTWGGKERGGIVVRDGDVSVKVLPDTPTARSAFQQVLQDGGNPDDFMRWLAGRRAVALESAGVETPFNAFAAKAAMQSKTLAAKYAKGAALWDAFTKGARDYARASGRYSAEQIKGMEDADLSTWVSFNRIMGKEVGFTRRGFTVGAPVKGMKGGSEGLIGDMLSNSLDNVSAMFRAADNNYAVAKLVSMAEANPDFAAALGVRELRVAKNPNLDVVENEMKAYGIPEDKWEAARPAIQSLMQDREALKPNELAFYRDGQKEVWRTGWPELAQMIKGSTPIQVEGLSKVFQSIGHAVSGAITAMPDFAIKMFGSHQLVQFINSPLRMRELPAATGLTGLAKLMGMDGMLEDVMANGGLGSSMRALDRDNHYDMMTQVLGETGWLDRVRNDVGQYKAAPSLAAAKQVGQTAILSPVRVLRAMNERLDLGNRVGLSEAAKGAGMSPLKAGAHAAEYGIDYTNGSAYAIVNWWAGMVPFMRAGLLYQEQAVKAIERNPGAYAAAAATAVTLPKMALYIANMIQDDIPAGEPGALSENDKYRNLSAWERLYYFITPSVNGQRFKLRMPDYAAYVFGALPEAAMMAMYEHNPARLRDLGTTFLHDFVPPLTPPALQAPAEVLTNTNLETWQPLVSDSQRGVAGELRYIQETSGPAKALAKLLGPDNNAPLIGVGHIPPMAAIEHIVTSWGGPIGQQILSAVGARPGPPGAPFDWAKAPFAQAFLIAHPEGGRALDDYYAEKDRFDQWAQAKSELHHEARRGDTSNFSYNAEARRFAAEDERAMQTSIAIGRMRDSIYAIDANPNMPDDDKRQRTNQIVDQMVTIAEAATAQMRKIQ